MVTLTIKKAPELHLVLGLFTWGYLLTSAGRVRRIRLIDFDEAVNSS